MGPRMGGGRLGSCQTLAAAPDSISRLHSAELSSPRALERGQAFP